MSNQVYSNKEQIYPSVSPTLTNFSSTKTAIEGTDVLAPYTSYLLENFSMLEGNYLIIIDMIGSSITDIGVNFLIEIDGIPIESRTIVVPLIGGSVEFNYIESVNLSAGSHSFNLLFSSLSPGTVVNILLGKIIAIKIA